MAGTGTLDSIYAALSDPTRREIVRQLTRGDATVSELAGPHRTTFQAVSQHIKVLETAGLVSRTKVGRTRPCRLEPDALTAAMSWIEDARRMWVGRLDRLESHLVGLQAERDADRG